MIKNTKIVKVDWVDSCSHNGWIRSDDVALQATPLKCQTVGYLINESKTAIAIAQNKTMMTEEGYRPYGDIIHIPKSAIMGKTFLEDNKRRRK